MPTGQASAGDPRLAARAWELLLAGDELVTTAWFAKAAYALRPDEPISGYRRDATPVHENWVPRNDKNPTADGFREDLVNAEWKFPDSLPGLLPEPPNTSATEAGDWHLGFAKGIYTFGNAAATFAVKGDTAVIAFRGTNDGRHNNPLWVNESEDQDHWLGFDDRGTHYALLQPFITAFELFLARETSKDIRHVLVTGHSLGAAMVIPFMRDHPDGSHGGRDFFAVTYATPGYDSRAFSDDNRIVNFWVKDDVLDWVSTASFVVGDDNEWDVHVDVFTLTPSQRHSMDLYANLAVRTAAVGLGARQLAGPIDGVNHEFLDVPISGRFRQFADDGYRGDSDQDGYYDFFEPTESRTVAWVQPQNRVAIGGAGNDSLVGGPLNDRLYGARGRDTLHSGLGYDYLDGGTGNDLLTARSGDDSLHGGAGSDSYEVRRTDDDLDISSSVPRYVVYDESGDLDILTIADTVSVVSLDAFDDLVFEIVGDDLVIDLDLRGALGVNDDDEGRIVIEQQGVAVHRIETLRLESAFGAAIGADVSLYSLWFALLSFGPESGPRRLALSPNSGAFGRLVLGIDGAARIEDERTGAGSGPLWPGSVVDGLLQVPDDRDFFEVPIEKGGEFTFYTTGSTDTFGRLYTADYRLLAEDDDWGTGVNFNFTRTLAPGTYYVEVTGRYGAGNYRLHAEGQGAPTVSDDHGSAHWSATPVVLGGAGRAGTIDASDDRDYFSFVVTNGGTYTITTTGNVDTYGRLYDAVRSELASSASGGAGANFKIERKLTPGTYVVEVSSSFSTGSYSFGVEGPAGTVGPAPWAVDGSVEVGVIKAARLENGYDRDIYRFAVTQGGKHVLYATSGTWTSGELYDANYTVLASDMYSGQGQNFAIARQLAPGTYYIAVTGRGGNYGPYELHVDGPGLGTSSDDAGDSAWSAELVALGTITNATLHESDERDFYAFTVAKGGTHVLYATSDTWTTGELYDANYALLASDTYSGQGQNFRISRQLTPGTYYISVTGRGGNAGAYELHLDGSGLGTAGDDSGDSAWSAKAAAVGSITNATLHQSDDRDFYAFTLTKSGTHVLYATSGTWTTGELYDANYTLLASDDYSGQGQNFRISRQLTPGTYYISVTGRGGNAGAYELHLDGPGLGTAGDDSGDSAWSAKAVAVGSITNATLHESDDRDFYAFTVAKGGTHVLYATSDTWTTGELYDANYALLVSDNYSGQGQNFRISRQLTPGTYYISVTGRGGNAGAYELHLDGPGLRTAGDDSGDSAWSAKPVVLGSITNAMLHQPDELDFYAFTVLQGGTYAIRTISNTWTAGELFDANLSLVTSSQGGGQGQNFAISRQLAPGNYYIAVTGRGGNAGAYELHLNGPTSPTGAAPWLTTQLIVGGLATAELTSGASKRYYSIDIADSGNYTIFTTGSTNTAGVLFDATYSEIASDQNAGESSNFAITRQLTPGTYFVEVSGEFSTGRYELHVEGRGAPTPGDDHGYSPWSATAVTIGSKTQGALTVADDRDYFQVTIDKPATYRFFSTGGTNTVGRLLDANWQTLASDDDDGPDRNFGITRALVPGQYTIEVTGSFAAGTYWLHVEGPGAATESDRHGESPWSSTPVALGSVTAGVLTASDDRDYFLLEIAESTDCAIFTRGTTDVRGRMLDANLLEIASDSDSGEGRQFAITRKLTPGSYYIEVSGEYSSGRYDLHIEAPGSITVTDDHGYSPWSAVSPAVTRTPFETTLAAGADDLELIGTAPIAGIGNDRANRVIGNSANNRLEGLGGNDSLAGGLGQDVLIGGDGNDLLQGSDHSESRDEPFQGDSDDDRLSGGPGDDSLDGGVGNFDWLDGGAGNDTLDGGATSTLTYNVDIAIFHGDAPLSANLQSGIATQAGLTDTLVRIDAVFASAGSDTLRGIDGPASQRGETLRGGGGDDTINGGAGVDTAEFIGLRRDYIVGRSDASTWTVRDNNPGNGDEGTDQLTNIERIIFADQMLSFGARAEDLARVAFVLWTKDIVSSASLFARGLSYYDVGYDFDTMTVAALLFWTSDSDTALAERLIRNSGSTKTASQLLTTMAANGGGIDGRAAALREIAFDQATTLLIDQSGIREAGLVSDHFVPGFGTLFSLLPT